MKLKKKDFVLVTSGKFKGWRGTIFEKEFDRRDKRNYYDIFADYKEHRGGRTYGRDIGLGMIINIPEKHLKEIV